MKAKRKPIEDEIYHNVAGGEEFPAWLKFVAEPGAAPGRTFLINSDEYGRRLVPSGYYVIKGPTDIYPCSPAGFQATYEQPEVRAHVPSSNPVPDMNVRARAVADDEGEEA